MSQENIELVRRAFASISQGNIELAFEAAADDFVMDWSRSVGPAKGIYRGKGGVQDALTSYLDAFDSVQWNPEEFIEVDESRLIVVNRVELRGRSSGIEVVASGAQLWTIHEGQAQSAELFQSRADALEAAGLSE